jgi:hypothetical protein
VSVETLLRGGTTQREIARRNGRGSKRRVVLPEIKTNAAASTVPSTYTSSTGKKPVSCDPCLRSLALVRTRCTSSRRKATIVQNHTPPSHGAVHSAGIADAGGSVVTIGRFISDGISGGGMLVYADQGTARLVVLVCWLLDVPYGPPSNVLTSLVFMTNEVATAPGSVPAARVDPSRSARRIDGPQTHSLNSRGNRRQPRYVHKSVRIYLPPAANCQSVGPISAHHTDCGCAPQISPAQQQPVRVPGAELASSWRQRPAVQCPSSPKGTLLVFDEADLRARSEPQRGP